MKPGIIGAKNRPLKRPVSETIEKPADTGKEHFGGDAICVLIFDASGGFPRCRKILISKRFMKMDALVVLVHIDAAESFGFAHDMADRVIRARTWRKSIGDYPDTFETFGIFDNFRRPVAKFLLHPFPSRGRLVNMAIRGYQLKIRHAFPPEKSFN